MNKRLVIILLLGMFLMSFTSALISTDFQVDETKSRDSTTNYGTITLKDRWFVDVFGWFEETKAEITLKENTEVCSNNCEAIKEITMYDRGKLVDSVKFETILDDGSRIEQPIRSYQFYIQTANTQKEVNDYELVCTPTGKISVNGTVEETCENKLIGTHLENNPEWTEYNYEELDAGNYVLKLVGKKKAERNVDWIITSQGKELDVWAVWGETDLSNGIIAYWNMSSETDSITGKYNLTGGTAPQVTGLIGTAYNFTGGGTTRTVGNGNTLLTGLSNFSISLWANQVTFASGFGSYFGTAEAGTDFWQMGWHNSVTAQKPAFVDKSTYNVVNQTAPTNEWFNFIATKNGTTLKLYLNGEYVGLHVLSNLNQSAPLFMGGGIWSPANALIDEVGVWNRTLTLDEAVQLYNDGDGLEYMSDELTVTLNSPADDYISTTIEVDFNCSAIIYGGATLTNMSLLTNESGSWEIVNTTNLFYLENKDHELSDTYTTDVTDTYFTRISIVGTDDWVLQNVTLMEGVTGAGYPTNFTLWYENGTIIMSKSFSGTVVSGINQPLIAGGEYRLGFSSNGAGYSLRDTASSGIQTGAIYWVGSARNGNTAERNVIAMIDSIDIESPEITINEQIFSNIITSETDWTCQACDSDGDCGFASENRTLSVDATAPTILINSGNGTQNYGSLTTNHTVNYTITDSNLGSIWISYNGTNTTINGESGIQNTTNFALEEGIYNATIYANDSVGNVESEFFSWDYRVFENSITYNENTIEGSLETFVLNIDSTGGIVGARLNYNGTNYDSNILSLGSGKFNISNTISIPDFAVETNATFFFNLTTSTGSYIITTENIQQVSASLLDNCAAYTYELFDLTLYDERTLNNINGTIEATATFFNQDKSAELSTKSINFSNVNNANICSNINMTGNGYFYDLELRYYQFGTNSTTYQYVPELYHIQKGATSNFPQTIGLYDLAVNESTEFTINYRDNNYVARSGVLLQIQRKYISEGVYRTVEAPLTSNEGSAIGHFDLGSYKYKIIASLDGEILNTFDDVAVACESELSGICIININGQSNPTPYINTEDYEDFSYSITQDENTISVDYSVPSGETETVNVVMVQYSTTADPKVLCNTSLTSSSGSFECSANSTIGDSEVLIDINWDDNYKRAKAYLQEDLGDFFLLNNYVIAALFVIILVTMMVSSPPFMVGASIFSVALLGFVFLIKGSSIGLVLGGMSWLIISGIIILIKINKKDET